MTQSRTVKCEKMQGQTTIVRIVQEGDKCFREEIPVMLGGRHQPPSGSLFRIL
jgi:hypothetical protein